MQGRRAIDYIGPSTSQETAALLAGRLAGVTVQFNKYIFDEEQSQLEDRLGDAKENRFVAAAAAGCRPVTDFLREVEKIFLADIAGSRDAVTADAVLSDITPR